MVGKERSFLMRSISALLNVGIANIADKRTLISIMSDSTQLNLLKEVEFYLIKIWECQDSAGR